MESVLPVQEPARGAEREAECVPEHEAGCDAEPEATIALPEEPPTGVE